jgi:hypothetical protein
MPWLEPVVRFILAVIGLKGRGYRNAFDVGVETVDFELANLPDGFDGFRILLVSDLHIDAFAELVGRIAGLVEDIEYDLCILGGDYSFDHHEESEIACCRMRELAGVLVRKGRVLGVLGNHDRYRMGQVLSDCGVEMLVNENACVERDGGRIYVAGVDDCHYYESADMGLAGEGIEGESFRIMVSHSPETYKQAAEGGYSLFLAGHTHGGQVCLPGGFAVVTCASVDRRMIRGKWQCDGMAGYTSRGAGASGVAVRFFSKPEITVITLKKKRAVPEG